MVVLEGHTAAGELDIDPAAVRHIVAAAEVHRTGLVEGPAARHTALAEAARHTGLVRCTGLVEAVRHTVPAAVLEVHHIGLVGEAVRPIAVAEGELHTGLGEVVHRTG